MGEGEGEGEVRGGRGSLCVTYVSAFACVSHVCVCMCVCACACVCARTCACVCHSGSVAAAAYLERRACPLPRARVHAVCRIPQQHHAPTQAAPALSEGHAVLYRALKDVGLGRSRDLGGERGGGWWVST